MIHRNRESYAKNQKPEAPHQVCRAARKEAEKNVRVVCKRLTLVVYSMYKNNPYSIYTEYHIPYTNTIYSMVVNGICHKPSYLTSTINRKAQQTMQVCRAAPTRKVAENNVSVVHPRYHKPI